MHKSKANTEEMDGKAPSLWEWVLGLIEHDLCERRTRKLFVEVRDESGTTCRKEIGELSVSERRSLDPALREHVLERLLDRHLAEQGRVDLLEKRRAYTKELKELVPEDLPAFIETDRQRTEEERRKGLEREEFVREARADLERLLGGKLLLTGTTEAGNEERLS
jgi:hypothetical protein